MQDIKHKGGKQQIKMGVFSVRYSPWMKEDGDAEVHHGIEAQPVHTSPTYKQTEKIRLLCPQAHHIPPPKKLR